MEIERWRGSREEGGGPTKEELSKGLCFIERKFHATFVICPTKWTKTADFIWYVVDSVRLLPHMCPICEEWSWRHLIGKSLIIINENN